MITDVWGFGFKDWLRVSGCKGWGFRILGLGYQGLGLDFIGFLGAVTSVSTVRGQGFCRFPACFAGLQSRT